MKIPTHWIVVLFFVIQSSPSKGHDQDYGSEIVRSMIQSSNWLENAWNKSFELKISRRKTDLREPQGEYAKQIPDVHHDAVNQLFILRDSPSKHWCVSRAVGWSRLGISFDQKIDNEQYSNAIYAIANKDDKIALFRLPREIPEEFRRTPAHLLDELLDAEVGQLAISILSMQRKPGSDFFDYLVDFCLDPSNKSLINKRVELVDGVNRIIYRISMRYSDDTVYGIRIVVSESGFDRGLITELHYGYIKKDEFKAPYLSEDQLQILPKIYVKTKWQEFVAEGIIQETIVVPNHISKREDSTQAIKSAQLANYDFDWRPLSDESKQKINLEEAKKKAEELAKDIDRILNR